MIRIRITKGVTPEILLNDGYEKVTTSSGTYYKKSVGSLEVQMKMTFPYNLRVQNWGVPWILLKFLLGLEEGADSDGLIKVIDSGKYKILNVNDTLDLIRELNKYTDVYKRLSKWYQEYIDGVLKI